jgi:hypothetical protein
LFSNLFRKLHVVDFMSLEPPKPKVDEIFLKQKYVEEGLSSNEIAKLTFSSRATITNHLNKAGIPLKKVTRRIDGGHVFGFRKYGGTSIEMKKEQEVICPNRKLTQPNQKLKIPRLEANIKL